MLKDNKIQFGELDINNTQNTQTPKNDWANNFGNAETSTQNNKKTPIQENIIWQINLIDSQTPTRNSNGIHLDDINIKAQEVKEKPAIDFHLDDINEKNKKHFHINYRKIFILSFSTIFISSLISTWLYIYNDYITNYSNNINLENNDTSIVTDFIINIKKIIDWYINKDHNAPIDIQLNWENWENNLNKLINSKQNYIQKKETLKTSIKNLNDTILNDHKTLDNMKKTITKNWFLSNDISEIISEKQQIWSIQNSLLSLEAIKFSSAISVFSHLDTFIESLSKSINIPKNETQNKTKDIITRWEKDINLYITNCYLNPYETNYKCNIIWDFDKYYDITNDSNFQTNFFKELINYTDTKLEQTELPSFSITFQKFDQNKDEITFTIDINTFKQDEIELAKKWILSPHIFIFNNLINNLKQSKFIVWESISTKNLKIDTKVINIGSTQFVIHNSNKTFTLPIQKENEREIFDFVDDSL